jgi:hypothetical protein
MSKRHTPHEDDDEHLHRKRAAKARKKDRKQSRNAKRTRWQDQDE